MILVFGFIGLAVFVWMVLILIKPQQFLPFFKGSNTLKRVIGVIAWLVITGALSAVVDEDNVGGLEFDRVKYDIVSVDTLKRPVIDRALGKVREIEEIQKLTFNVNVSRKCGESSLDSIARKIVDKKNIQDRVEVNFCYSFDDGNGQYIPFATTNVKDGHFSSFVNESAKGSAVLNGDVLPPNGNASVFGVYNQTGAGEIIVIYSEGGKWYSDTYVDGRGYSGDPDELEREMRNGNIVFIESKNEVGGHVYVSEYRVADNGDLDCYYDNEPNGTWKKLQ